MAGYLGHKPTISNYTVDEFTTSSAQASSGNFTLSQTVTNSKTLEVSVGGIDQPQSAYSVTGTTLAFGASVVTLGDIVIARHAGESISYPSLEDGTVTVTKIGSGAVTDVKIGGMASSKLTGALPAIDGSSLTGLAGVPTGIIAIWSGATNAIPTGWLICDGTNSTPDLRDRFIIGAGSTHSPGATGGSTSTGSHTLTVAQLASHNHTHTRVGSQSQNADLDNDVGGTVAFTTSTTSSTGSSSAHTHGGVLPPYYALAYIMKT